MSSSEDKCCWGKIFHEEISPSFGFQVPASRFLPPGPEFLSPGLGPFPRVWVPSPGSGSLPPASGFQAE
ncbi:hypothetical protein DY000_02015794 [Brassica cretica]|uniref:Uncharacterized protein n=1 Tax=Brassica cretica TaxID=69181 RepID=A0ABQ7CXH2_BRACR|nr:hypothetical protein DY000_02015794 [Brassica cretica]